MALKKIKDDLIELYKELGKLRSATPVDAPEYEKIKKKYRNASDLAEKAAEKAIDESDDDYVSFSTEMTNAINLIKEAKADIKKVAKAIEVTAKVIDIAGKIVARV
jgi:prephenate dehydrogenase